MIFIHPTWLTLILPLAAVLSIWRAPSHGVRVIRTAILAAIVLALAGLSVKISSNKGVLALLVDRSESMPDNITSSAAETAAILESTRPEESRFRVLSFAEKTQTEKISDNKFNGFIANLSGDQSRLASAIEKTLALIPKDAPGRILLVTDGAWTGEDPAPALTEAAARGVAVDYRYLHRPFAADPAIAGISAPHSVPAGELFNIVVRIYSPSSMETLYQIVKDGRTLANGKLRLRRGANRFFFRDKGEKPTVSRYEFKISTIDASDARPQNNKAKFLVEIEGVKPVLLLTMSKSSGLAETLRNGGFNIAVDTPGNFTFTLDKLSAYSGVVIENIPADKIGDEGLRLIAELVVNNGFGVMTTGGKNSYALGGYYKSPLEPILPVSMELRREHRKLAMSIVVALDRSGSMGAAVGGGETKMDLANISTVEVLNLLSQNDELCVSAVDSSPHVVVPVANLGDDNSGMASRIRSIESMGGGIFVYEALVAAVRMQMKAKAGTRHIILFADADDAEQPGKYKQLLDKTAKAGITVSVVGLGQPTDSDAALLRDVAARGNGRCLFSVNPRELPRLFAKDTFVVARSTFVDKPVSAKFAGALRSLSPLNFGCSMPLGGYNLCYARPKALVAASSEDEFKAPIISFWRRGLGRIVCYAGEVDGEHARAFAEWPHAGNLMAAMVGWMARFDNQRLPNGVMAVRKIENGIDHIQLLLDPERTSDPFSKLPEVVILSGRPGRPPKCSIVKMRWETPDVLGCETPMAGGEIYLASLRSYSFHPVVLPPVRLPYPPEFKPVVANSADKAKKLFNLCKGTGGRERINMANIWNDLPSLERYIPLDKWLLLAAVILLLLEVLERRGIGILRWPKTALTKIAELIRVFKLEVATMPDSKRATAKRQTEPAEKPADESVETKTKKSSKTDVLKKDPGKAPSLSDALRKAKKNK